MSALEEAFEVIATKIRPETMILIETTSSAWHYRTNRIPYNEEIILKRGIETDPLLAHSYERVMPGKDYVASIAGISGAYAVVSMRQPSRRS